MSQIVLGTPTHLSRTIGAQSKGLRRSNPRRFCCKGPVAQKPCDDAWRGVCYAASVEVDAEAVSFTPALPWDAQSGQPASNHFEQPLVGKSAPLGAHVETELGTTNFAIVSGNATKVSLVLFLEEDLQNGKSTIEIDLDPNTNKTGDIWHIALPGLQMGLLYAYRMSGHHQENDAEEVLESAEPEAQEEPTDVASGHRFDDSCVVLDPYGKAIISRREFGQLGQALDYSAGDVLGISRTWPQSACEIPHPERGEFDWQGDVCPQIPLEDLVIYEMHVRGFTRDPSSGVKSPGTYEGLVEKLDYLQDMGINCIELLPVHEFNELEYYEGAPGSQSPRVNFWGYSTINYFSPMSRYSASIARGGSGQEAVFEMKYLVQECHKRGIEVILDVVFNHSAEGNHLGPTLSFRGIDNRVYYMLAPGGEYYNYSGCGNTLNCNHPTVRQFIVDCLKYWVEEMHIDGFRFDLASILTRAHSAWHQGEMGPDGVWRPPHAVGGVLDDNGYMSNGGGVPTGTPLADPAVVEMISEEPLLRSTKLIAEAWDADGLNQVGAYPHYGGQWAEWNGHFRDVIRNFIKGTDGPWTGEFASVFCGSPNVYDDNEGEGSTWWKQNDGRKWCGGRGPMHSVNFVTAHDGFSLADLVTYNEKKNDANGENSNDGEDHNNSWNCGVEGRTSNETIQALRQKQMRNFMCALLLSHGVPMLTMGDEYGHSKEGNNNTYCHDSTLNWFDWNMAKEEDKNLLRFVKGLIRLRRMRSELRRRDYVSGNEVQWHGVTPCKPDWSEFSRLVAMTLSGTDGGGLYIAFNAAHTPQILTLPQWEGWQWNVIVDTGAITPFNCLIEDDHLSAEDINLVKTEKAPWLSEGTYPILPYSCVVLDAVSTGASTSSSRLLNKCDVPASPATQAP